MTKRQKKNLYRILIAVVLMAILHFVPLEGAQEVEEIVAVWRRDNRNPALGRYLQSIQK